ncbi:hypothetical protein NIES2135_04500 [Leptolyngbya boryana NIES-2135]|jgi:hypothetical protein|uniref:Uncharacterized protein n=1 Tax=Leptolyngbya boryana NIES-2135 TaxID=1973484 RepID=A0A1Z4JA89_LEPBY|nr:MULTISPECIES: hypothetical protein [Leptolyngbya]BAY53640.1 hypothetical protein NIES2135_04500 [Leptolyngbya boryana NIES-2135]MBD2371331.1 hypothetical protein [Leptolyngbya sp. FACHB-161]MBD2377810.1 hypothetical protein [Leptolyngbya sp. FACHB-238]MBD2402247.1 hypothetical protein [Leptolyngbya sp. FACHB-239]MBD2408740.1 hypothetical protein [Leptolyngbya sp. FACHB-402]
MGINWDALKQRYLQTNRAAQLESITLNLTRIQTLANSGEDGQVARHLVRESQYLIEWTVPTIDLETDFQIATELVDLQRQLSEWKLDWDKIWESDRASLGRLAQQWSDRLQICVAH